MVTGKKMLTLANVETVQDKTTGDRTNYTTIAMELGIPQGAREPFLFSLLKNSFGAVYEVKSNKRAYKLLNVSGWFGN